jgi:site-specific recombinase XerC
MESLKPINVVDLTVSVFTKPITIEVYINLMGEVIRQKYPDYETSRTVYVRYKECDLAVRHFESYLNHRKLTATMPSEEMMMDFHGYLMSQIGKEKERHCQKIVSLVRSLTNALPSDMLQRQLVTQQQFNKQHRFDHLTPKTQMALKDFLRDGRMTKRKDNELTLKSRLLSSAVREGVIYNALLLLKLIGKHDIFSITPKDAETFIKVYAQNGERDAAIRILYDIKPLYRNLIARNLVKKDPFPTVAEKPKKINDDYVPPEYMEQLRDLSTVNLKNFIDVRDRLLTFCLCYDFALRIGEIARLKADDVVLNNYVELTLRPEVQKGQSKRQIVPNSYFAESKALMECYLKLRADKGVQTDALIVSDKGEPLLSDGCRLAVQSQCKRLGIKTYRGKDPAPHRFRHTFGTLNIAPLGLGLSDYEIMHRMRHTDIRTTIDIYVTNNPSVAKAQHHARMNEINGRHKQPRFNPTQMHISSQVTSDDSPLSEDVAMHLLRPFDIKLASLRTYGEQAGIIERKDGNYYYSSEHIDDLRTNYYTKQEAMLMLRLKKSGFSYWVTSNKVVCKIIGKASLIPKSDVLDKCSAKKSA